MVHTRREMKAFGSEALLSQEGAMVTSGKSDFVEISPHLTGLTACDCHSGSASSEPILFGDWTSNSLQSSIADAWKVVLTGEPKHIVIHPVVPAEWSKKTARAFWHFCAELCRWQDDRGCFVTVVHPAYTGFLSSRCSRSLTLRTYQKDPLIACYDSKEIFDPRFAVLLSQCSTGGKH